MRRRPIYFSSGGETLAGELALPDSPPPHPAVLLIGGTLSDTRDGDPAISTTTELPRHALFRVLAEALAAAGVASLRWDKRGVGESTGLDRDAHSDVWTDVDDAEQALLTLLAAPEVDPVRVGVLGESAGAHLACLLAARSKAPAVYVLQAALYTSIVDMMRYNYQRVADFCARSPEDEAWVRQVAPGAYQLGRHWQEIMAGARRGEELYQSPEAEAGLRIHLRRFQQELDYAPAEQFRYIRKPVLVIQGDCDLNVPPTDCHAVAAAMVQAGNADVTLVVVPGADHSMQVAAEEVETRIRERISMASFARPYSEFFLRSLTAWLASRLGIKQMGLVPG